MHGRISVLAVLLFCRISFAEAQQPQTFALDTQTSQIQFLINSTMFPLEGSIDKFNGKLVQDAKAPHKVFIQFDCDLSSARLSQAQLAGVPISDLLASVQKSSARFEGNSVGITKNGALKMRGILRWKGKAYPVTFPVRIEGSGNKRVISGELSGEGEDLITEIPALALFQVHSASATAKITFKR